MDSRSMINLIVATLLSTLLLILLPAQTDAIIGAGVQKLIDNACKFPNAGDFKTCEAMLSQNPEISSATDAESLARIALGGVSNQSTIAMSVLSKTIKSHPKATKPLARCVDSFNATKNLLKLNHEALKEGLATLDVSFALDAVELCETLLGFDKVNIPQVGATINRWKTYYKPAYAALVVAQD